MSRDNPRLIGVDGCRGGWLAVTRQPGTPVTVRVFQDFLSLHRFAGENSIIAVDMPIGLPDHIDSDGRGPEKAVRMFLGKRKSSVFSIPSRGAVYAEVSGSLPLAEKLAAHQRACAVARNTSLPASGMSMQAFGIFAKIREVDALVSLIGQATIREVHPEMAFWRLNGEVAMAWPKHTRPGVMERRAVLVRHGFAADLLDARLPRGASLDDLLDACACSLIAGRIADGSARPFPARPQADSLGLQMAIWA